MTQNSNKKLLAIFGDNGALAAFLSLEKGIHPEYFNDFDPEQLTEFFEYVKSGQAKLAVEETEQDQVMVMGYLDIDAEHPLYVQALASELNRRGFLAAAVSEKARGTLLRLSDPAISEEKRKQVLGDIVHMGDKDLEILEQSWDELSRLK